MADEGRQVKIFTTFDQPSDLEGEINHWLDIHPELRVRQILQTAAGGPQDGRAVTITLYCEKKTVDAPATGGSEDDDDLMEIGLAIDE